MAFGTFSITHCEESRSLGAVQILSRQQLCSKQCFYLERQREKHGRLLPFKKTSFINEKVAFSLLPSAARKTRWKIISPSPTGCPDLAQYFLGWRNCPWRFHFSSIACPWAHKQTKAEVPQETPFSFLCCLRSSRSMWEAAFGVWDAALFDTGTVCHGSLCWGRLVQETQCFWTGCFSHPHEVLMVLEIYF